MLLRALKLNQVRNLAPLLLEPGERFNVFAGDNGQGKTNVLEAIYLAGTLRSFRTNRMAELIAFGQDEAYVAARVERGGLERLCEVTLRERSKVVRLDGKAVRPISKYFGEFNVVLFAPEDLAVPRGSPNDRRRFLDRAVFHRDPGYLEAARAYEKVLKSRNKLLRDAEGRLSAAAAAMLEVYDQQLAGHGARVISSRCRFLDQLRPRLQQAFESITSGGGESALSVDATYQGPEGLDLSDLDPTVLEAGLAGLIAASRGRDLGRQASNVGPHRDDLRFTMAERSAASFASQGQLRALVLGWKTAEMDLLAETYGEPPTLLLDDVSSELDPARNAYLFDFLRQRPGQCFITTTHGKHVLLTADRVDFRVAGGHITPLND